jgi:hypothetical protein
VLAGIAAPEVLDVQMKHMRRSDALTSHQEAFLHKVGD